MKSNFGFLRIITLALAAFVVFSGCSLFNISQGGELVEETLTVDPGGATTASVQLDVDMGDLKIQSMGGTLLQGKFEYNVPEWKPQMAYEVSGDKGVLRLTQPDAPTKLVNNAKNTWDLRLGEDLPMDLEVNLGTGQGVIDLSRIDITSLRVSTGAGDLNLDLRGAWTHDIDIIINHGLGEITLQLPSDLGVRVDINHGVGQINARGLEQNGSVYTNSLYGESSPRLNIQIEAGAGDINLEG